MSGNTLIRKHTEPCEENYETLFREYLARVIRWNIVKMSFFLKLIFKLKVISFISKQDLFVN